MFLLTGRRGRRLTALGILLLATATVARAADLGGQVTDQLTGLPLDRVVVRLVPPPGQPGEPPALIVTGPDGGFLWRDLPAAAYELECAAAGYEPRTTQVALGATDLLDLVVPLALGAFELEGLVVVGQTADTERELQTGYVNLDRATLANIPGIVEDDPLRALQLLPGVQAASDISSGLYIRGGGPDQNLVLMDDVPVYNPTHAFGFFSTFNNDAVRDLALYKGAYPAAYGGRLGAVLDVDMVQDTTPSCPARRAQPHVRASVPGGSRRRDQWWVAGRRTYLEPLLRAIDPPKNPCPTTTSTT